EPHQIFPLMFTLSTPSTCICLARGRANESRRQIRESVLVSWHIAPLFCLGILPATSEARPARKLRGLLASSTPASHLLIDKRELFLAGLFRGINNSACQSGQDPPPSRACAQNPGQ